MNGSVGKGLLGLALLLALTSCAGTRAGDVDLTPTARANVDAHVGKGFTSDSTRVDNIASTFSAGETVHAVVDVPGKIEGVVQVRWLRGAETIGEQAIAIMDGVNAYRFRLEAPAGGHPLGDYRFEVWIDGNRVESESFSVQG
jgi:hypothetical protein